MQSPERLSRGMAAAWLAIVVLTAYFVFIGGASPGFLFPHVRLFSIVLVAGVLVMWSVAARRNRLLLPSSAMWPALLIGIVAFASSTLLSSNVRVSVEYLAYAAVLVLLYLLVVRIVSQPVLRVRIIGLAGGLAVLISVMYIVLVVRHWLDWWSVVGRVALPPLRPDFEGLVFSDPGGTAAITTMLASPAVAWLAVRGRSHRVAAIGLVVLVGVVVFLTGARGAWLGVAVGIAALAVVVLVTPRLREPLLTAARAIPRGWVVAAVAVLVIAVVLIGPTIIRRAGAGGDDLRFTLALTGLRQFVEEPLDGGGPGMWVIRRAAFTQTDEIDYYIPHAHNIYAQTLAEFGILGIIAAVVIAYFLGRLILRSLRSASAERRSIALAATFVLTYFGVHQLVDMYVNVPAILFAAVLPVALLDGMTEPDDVPRVAVGRGIGRVGVPVIGAVAVGSLIVVAAISSTALPAIQIGTLANGDNWSGAAGVASDVVAADPDLPGHRFLHGLTAARKGDLETAERELKASVDADDFVFAWVNLAALQLDRGDEEAARTSLERAMRLGWQQPAITLPAGVLYQQLGDADAAVDAFAQALMIAPMLTDDPFWTESGSEIAAAHDAAVEQAVASSPPETAALITLLEGDYEAARAQAGLLEEPARAVAQLAIGAWEGSEADLKALESVAAADPTNRPPLVWLSRLAAREGDVDAVARYRRWISTLVVSGRDVGDDTVVTDDPIAGAQVPGANGNLQGWFVYVRQYPWDLLIPGLPKLTLE